MGMYVVLGMTAIAVINDQFHKGYQEGYQRFTEHYQKTPLSDRQIYSFLATNIYDSMTTDCYRAGYILGWCAALQALGHPGPMIGYYSALEPQAGEVQV